MPYTPIGWKDFPNEETPLSATNLNKMDMQIKENTEKLDNFNPDLPNNVALYKEEHSTTEPIPRDADLLEGHPSSYYAKQTEIGEVKENLTQKQNSVKIGIFTINTVANSAVEINASTISSGELPPSAYTLFTPYSVSASRDYYADIHYDSDKLFIYSNKAQTVAVRWFNFS